MQRNLALAGATTLCAAALALALPQPAQASSIGVYFAADASRCSTGHAAFSQLTWFVFAHLYGSDAVAAGIAGGAYRVTGVPTNWFHSVQPNPNIEFPMGNLFGDGVWFTLAFTPCHTDPNGFVMLHTITSFAVSQIDHLVYDVEAPLLPNHPAYEYPVLLTCDDYTPVCVPGTPGYVNGSSCTPTTPGPVECPTVGVEPRTWGGLKKLYGQ